MAKNFENNNKIKNNLKFKKLTQIETVTFDTTLLENNVASHLANSSSPFSSINLSVPLLQAPFPSLIHSFLFNKYPLYVC